MHPIYTTLVQSGERLILKYLVSLNCVPHKHVDVAKSQDDLAVATYLEEQQQHWSCTMRIFPSLLVLHTEEWQQDNVHCQLSVVNGDRRQRETGCFGRVCLCLQGEQKPCMITLSVH